MHADQRDRIAYTHANKGQSFKASNLLFHPLTCSYTTTTKATETLSLSLGAEGLDLLPKMEAMMLNEDKNISCKSVVLLLGNPVVIRLYR